MNNPIARIVVLLDAAVENRTAIETAARLAARTRSPLHGVFVEDEELLHLAALPFARQITIDRGAEPLSREDIALQLRAEAERARAALLSMGRQFRLECTFEVIRAASAIAAAHVSRRDLVVAGERVRPIAGHFRVRPRWRSSVEAATGPILLARHPWTAPGSVAILLRDRDAGSARLFETAAQIAAATDSMLAVLCAPALAAAAEMERWIAERAAPHGVRVRIEATPAEPAALRERLGQLDCRVIALEAGLFEGGDGGLVGLIDRFSCDMLVVP
jgi:hypothetical protein